MRLLTRDLTARRSPHIVYAGRGFWWRRGFALESVAARICREAGGRVATNLFIRDLEPPGAANNGRRLEAVVDGLPLHGGVQLAVDTALVSVHGFTFVLPPPPSSPLPFKAPLKG